MEAKTPNKAELDNFTGTSCYYRYMRLLLTDGAKYMAETCKAWWLIDFVAGCQVHEKVKKEYFQVYKFKKTTYSNKEADVTVEDGNHNLLYTQHIPFTDFPWDEFEIWCIEKVVLLPSEY